ncbi:MAG: hypothetical protein LBT09_15200, partial [Planctomycetaceae bacterium]|nr:hypothetical protein [Planctomycetaceae bacterium]
GSFNVGVFFGQMMFRICQRNMIADFRIDRSNRVKIKIFCNPDFVFTRNRAFAEISALRGSQPVIAV